MICSLIVRCELPSLLLGISGGLEASAKSQKQTTPYNTKYPPLKQILQNTLQNTLQKIAALADGYYLYMDLLAFRSKIVVLVEF